MNRSPVRFFDNSTPNGVGLRVLRNTNALFASLPEPLQEKLRPYCSRIALRPGQRLFAYGEPLPSIYFPESGAIGLFSSLTSGHTLQVGLVDRHGMAGLPALDRAPVIPCDAVAQLPGTAIGLRHAALRLALADESFYQMLQRYLYELLVSGMQLTICNAFHGVEQRAARWLLALSDIAGNEFPLTHDSLSTMLGVRRPSVTLSALVLQHRGAIEYRHGRMRIVSRAALVQAACECYNAMRTQRSPRFRTEHI